MQFREPDEMTQGHSRVATIIAAYAAVMIGLPLVFGECWWVFAVIAALLPIARRLLLTCPECGEYRLRRRRLGALDGACSVCGKD